MAEFEKSIEYILEIEKGFVNDPDDHGHATNFGITQDTLARWRKRPVSIEDVRTMDVTEAKEIYKAWWWNALDLDKISDQRVATALLDVGVNFGIVRSSKLVQQSVGAKIDGQLGPITQASINCLSRTIFLAKFIDVVQDFYVNIVIQDQTQLKFLRGWINRSQKMLSLLA